jgi:hypothetical protein
VVAACSVPSGGQQDVPAWAAGIQHRQQLTQHLPDGWTLLRVVDSTEGTGGHASLDLLQGCCGVHQELDSDAGGVRGLVLGCLPSEFLGLDKAMG